LYVLNFSNLSRINLLEVFTTSFNMTANTLDKKTREIEKSERDYRKLFDSLKVGVYQCEPGVKGVYVA